VTFKDAAGVTCYFTNLDANTGLCPPPPPCQQGLAGQVLGSPVTCTPATDTHTDTTTTTVSCPSGLQANSGGGCDDTRHLPCPAGYTGWQNSQVDNCLQKPAP
jgi:hypothetical protein